MWASILRQWRTMSKEAIDRSIIVVKFLCLLHLTDTYLFSPVIVHGPSMLPTLNTRGDVLIVDRISHRFGKVELGDVVLVKAPHNPQRVLSKRVLGMEGDLVSFNARSGIFKTLVVPKGHVWIQGDNLYASNDSRHFGPVPYGLIQGKAFCRDFDGTLHHWGLGGIGRRFGLYVGRFGRLLILDHWGQYKVR